MTHVLALHKLHKTVVSLFLPWGSYTGHKKNWSSDKSTQYNISGWIYHNYLFLYIKVDQNEQLLLIFIAARSNITTIIYMSFAEIRATHISPQSDSFYLDFMRLMNNSFHSISWYDIYDNRFLLIFVFLTRNRDFNCFN